MSSGGIFATGERGARRDIVTPEGMPVPVFLAARSQRAGALFLDLLFILICLVVLGVIVLSVYDHGDAPGWEVSIYLLISFLLRNFYFTIFEVYWRGATPGKRLMHLRVIDRKGGRLKADAIFARNLMREVEIFMPLTLLFSGEAVGDEACSASRRMSPISRLAIRMSTGSAFGGCRVAMAFTASNRMPLSALIAALTNASFMRGALSRASASRAMRLTSSFPLAAALSKGWSTSG